MTAEAVQAGQLSVAKRRLLEWRLRGMADARRPEIPRVDGAGPRPLSPVQHGMWLANQLLADNSGYGVQWTMWLHGDLDVSALRAALGILVRRHEELRVTFRRTDDGAVCVDSDINTDTDAVLGIAPRADTAEDAVQVAYELATRPFDLEHGPLFGATLVPVDERTHMLAVRAHHLLVDEWTGALIARELGDLYAALATGREPGTSEPALRYSDYARWQHERVSGPLGERQLEYWRRALSQTAPLLELPTDRVRAGMASQRGAILHRTLPAAVSDGVRALAADNRTTVFTALLTLWAALLHRYSGQSGFNVGSLVAGRPVPETESLLGLFANTVAIPVDLSGDPTVASAVARTNESVVGALDNADVPFDQVAADLRVERTLAHNPLFQVLFQIVEAGANPWHFGDIDVTPLPLERGSAKVDLTLVAVNGPDIELVLTYAEDVYDEPTAARLLDNLVCLITRAVTAPGQSLSTLDILTDVERHRAVREWNDTDMAFPSDATVHELVDRQARQDPGRVAVRRVDGGVMTYGELVSRANRLAHYLRARGVGPESMVGVCVDHSTDMFVVLLGVLKAGAAYVPLDTALPAQRLEWILTDTAAPLVVTTDALHDRLPSGYSGDIIRVDTDWPGIAAMPEDTPQPWSDPDNLLYVIYTSGSTGRPKGVLVPHRGVVSYLHWAITGYGVQGERGAPMLGSIAFDLSVPNFWLPLISGRCVTLLPTDRSLETLADVLREPHDFSLLKITPGHLDVLRGMLAPGSVGSVRTFVVGADEVRPETVAGWRRIAPKARIINEYGPTETVVGCSVHVIEDDFDPAQSVSIGRPIGNIRMYVLDAAMHPVPVGVVGELYIGGIGVARGYLHRPALTAEKFVPDPFGAPGDRLYRTGDLARYRLSGELDFLGRNDFQVKVRGYRIELGEVEARLGLHPGVVDAVAAAVAAPGGHKRLVGYLVAADPDDPPTPSQLRAFMAEVLPDYMVPSVFVVLPAMPLTAAGKCDRTALPPPGAATARSGARGKPRTATERALTAIWSDVLGRADIGTHDNFFDLGGDSVLAIKVAARARRAGLPMSMAALFAHQTVDALATALDATEPEQPAHDTATDAIADSPGARRLARLGDVGRLSPLQAGMFLQNVVDPQAGDYLAQFVFTFDGELDHVAMTRAWRLVIDRHAALRTSFHWRDLPYPVRVVHRDAAVPVHCHDWSDVPGDVPGRLAALLRTERGRGFPDGLPPQRVHLIRCAARTHRMVWLFHHALLDGWSMPIVLDELCAAYGAFVAGTTPQLPPPVSPQEHLAWLARRNHEAEAAFWRDTLAGFAEPTPISCVLPEHDGPDDPDGKPHVARHLLSTVETTRLRDLARHHRTTLGVLLQSAWALALARDSGRHDVVFGATMAGRSADIPDLDRLVGMLMNTVPVRVRFHRDETLGAWLGRMQAEQVELRHHEHSVLGDVQRFSAVPTGTPLFDSIVVFDNVASGQANLPGARLTDVATDHGRSGYPLVLDIADSDRLEIVLFADPARVRADDATGMLAAYRELLTDLTADDVSLPGLLPDATAATTRQAAERPAATSGSLPRSSTENALTAIWTDVLGVPDIGPHDDFVELGGDSILAMQVVARARDHGLALRPRYLFTHPTIATLATVCEPVSVDQHTVPEGTDENNLALLRDRFAPGAVTDAYPLSPLQTGILFHSISDAGAYVQVFGFHIDADLDIALWEQAWRVVAQRHPALRTSFAWRDLPHPLQVVRSDAHVPLAVTDWRRTPPDEQATRLRELVAAEQRTGFDLSAAPPLRLTLVRTGDQAWELLWRSHHIVLDGWSLAAVFREVWTVYRSLTEHDRIPELPAPTPYRAYLAWVGAQDKDTENAYWARLLAGFSDPTPLPAATASTSAAGSGIAVADAPADLVAALHRAARRERVTVGAIVHAAWALLLAGHSAGDDVVFGSTVTGRSAPVPGIENVVGMVMNTLPVRATMARERPLRRWLKSMHDQLTELREHEHSALTDVRRHAAMRGDRRLFDSIVVFHNERHGTDDLPPGVSVIPQVDALDTGYPLVLDAILTDGLQLQLNYRRDRYDDATARELVEDCLALLGDLADADTTCAGALARLRPISPTATRVLTETAAEGFVPPRTAEEQTLSEIWAEVLGVGRVGIHDDLFELGGDSVLAIQIVSRARQAGIPIGARQLFDHPTIAALSLADLPDAEPVPIRAEQGMVTGPVPMTPIHRWFTELDWPHDHYNQSVLLRSEHTLDGGLVERALAALAEHHDALRLRLTENDGTWHEHIADHVGDDGSPLVRTVDLTGVAEPDAVISATASAAHTSLDLTHGPLLRAVLYHDARDGDRLLIVIHHIAVDTVSWSILLDDLRLAYRQLAEGAAVALPPKTTSAQYWAARLTEYAAGDEFADEARYWRALESTAPALPADHDGPNTEGTTTELHRSTSAIVHGVGAVPRARAEDLLLTALARTLAEWTGDATVAFDVERHGREPLFDDIDLSRTVGWFTAVQPVVVTLGGDAVGDLAAVTEHLRGVPHRGIGAGLARHRVASQIVANYHGQQGRGDEHEWLRPDPGSTGVARASDGVRPYLIEVDAAISEGRLHVTWKFSQNRHDRATIERLADSHVRHLKELCHPTGSVADAVACRVFPGAPTLMLPAARWRLPAVSAAVVVDGEIERAFAHGVTDQGSGTPVTPRTLFQAGSASKQVTALTVLRLVDEAVLDLDRHADDYLRSWRIDAPVTLRHLLTHTAGLTFHDYVGYDNDGPVPSVPEILVGAGNANTPAVRPELPPGAEYRYSGSHYTVLQQLLTDMTGRTFADLARTLVFEPLGLRDSGYGPEFATRHADGVAIGHRSTGVAYRGGWRILPELAAAGLWTTPCDLARITLEIHRGAHGHGTLLSPRTGRQMITQTREHGYGLGVFVFPLAGRTRIGHGGETPGYKTLSTFDWETGAGAVLMTNSDAGREFLRGVHADLGLTDTGVLDG